MKLPHLKPKSKKQETGPALIGIALLIAGIVFAAAGGLFAFGIVNSHDLSLVNNGQPPNVLIIVNQSGGPSNALLSGTFPITIQANSVPQATYTLQQLMSSSTKYFQPISFSPDKIWCQFPAGPFTITFPASVMTGAGQFLTQQNAFSGSAVNRTGNSPTVTVQVNYILQSGGVNATAHETLVLSETAGGSISLPPGTYTDNGYGWTIYAAPSSGYVFSNWILDGSKVSGTSMLVNGTHGSQISIIPSATSHTLQAVFTQLQYGTLTINSAAGGTTNPAPGVYADQGNGFTVTAVPASGYAFSYWILNNATITPQAVSTEPDVLVLPSTSGAGGSSTSYSLTPVFIQTGITGTMIGGAMLAVAALCIFLGIGILSINARSGKRQ